MLRGGPEDATSDGREILLDHVLDLLGRYPFLTFPAFYVIVLGVLAAMLVVPTSWGRPKRPLTGITTSIEIVCVPRAQRPF